MFYRTRYLQRVVLSHVYTSKYLDADSRDKTRTGPVKSEPYVSKDLSGNGLDGRFSTS